MMKWMCVCVVLVALAVPQAMGAEGRLKPELGMSLVISPDYNDTLKESYPNSSVSGGYGWLGLHLGLRYQVTEQFLLVPRIGLLFNYVASVGGGDSFANTIVQPAIAGRLLFTKGSSFYIEGEVSHNTVNTGSDNFDVDGGVGYAGLLGYQWENGFDIGAGYSVISTDVSNRTGVEDKNFGGVELRFRGTF
jgi:hypothetical protein